MDQSLACDYVWVRVCWNAKLDAFVPDNVIRNWIRGRTAVLALGLVGESSIRPFKRICAAQSIHNNYIRGQASLFGFLDRAPVRERTRGDPRAGSSIWIQEAEVS